VRTLLLGLVIALASAAITVFGLSKHDQRVIREAQQVETAQVVQKAAEAEAAVLPPHVETVTRIKTITKETIREVPVFVPVDGACPLPPGWRVLHDAAAAGEVPDPSRIPDAAPADPQAAASAVADNYGSCHENAEQLRALQQWLLKVSQ
jgi:hypothetical protein